MSPWPSGYAQRLVIGTSQVRISAWPALVVFNFCCFNPNFSDFELKTFRPFTFRCPLVLISFHFTSTEGVSRKVKGLTRSERFALASWKTVNAWVEESDPHVGRFIKSLGQPGKIITFFSYSLCRRKKWRRIDWAQKIQSFGLSFEIFGKNRFLPPQRFWVFWG